MPSAKSVLASRRGGPSLALNLSQSTLELPAHKLHRQNSFESTLSSDSGLCSSPGTGFLSVAPSCHSSCSAPSSPIGPKFKLTRDFDAAVCRLNQHKTLVSKILSSRFLRRWENHSVRLELHAIDSLQSTGFMSEAIPYDSISEVYATKRWDPHHKFCLRISLTDGTSALFQAPSSYLRDQWLHSILWSKQAMVDLSLSTPLQDTSIYQTTLDILCGYLHNIDNANSDDLGGCYGNQVIAVMTPLLERCTPTQPICEYLCKLCDNDLPLVTGQLAPVIERIIKRNTDFGKYPGSRRLVESYLKALSRLDKHSRRVPGQSPRKRARSRSAERCLDFNGFKGHQCASARGHKTGSSLSVITCYRPPTIQEQCGAEQGYQVTSSLSVYHASSAASAPSSESNQIGDNATETPSPSNGSSEVFRGTDSPMTNNDRNDSCQDRVIAVSSTGSIINVQVVSDTDTSEGLCARNPQQPFTIGCQQRLEVPAALEDEVFRSDEPEPALPIPSSLKVSSPPRGGCTVEAFTRQMHGDSSVCPHPRILPNLVAVCLSAIYRAFSQNKDLKAEDLTCNDPDVLCFVRILTTLAEFEDWRLPLSQILQPIPFPSRFIESDAQVHFATRLEPVVRQLAKDPRCEVHQCLVGVRQNKNGWLQIFATSHDSEMYSLMCHALLKCNCLRKTFLSDTFSCSWALEPLILSSLRHQVVAVQCLAILLENHLIKNNDDLRSSAEAALQASPLGQRFFEGLQTKRQMYMRNTGDQASSCRSKTLGTVTLPPKSNDQDLHLLLINLSKTHDLNQVYALSLAFTEITDRSVESITQLEGLKKLNLWATKITDVGLEALCYRLSKLEEVNLCETSIGARGVEALTSLHQLRVVNLNSTRVTMDAYCKLKDRFPEMEVCDVRYTDAW
ncbi:C-Maf-inducing protein-like isoform X2 [Varroa jacobsoni]|uniref:C-Maf-inducing protein-like isoform X2 n=1 Tax=Varroa jacobsoni TaxID=62625 RepID=UPI000BF3B2F7|nr:C-Maf-inducing protein-like isoform X2 [Varroa jacobsoni]